MHHLRILHKNALHVEVLWSHIDMKPVAGGKLEDSRVVARKTALTDINLLRSGTKLRHAYSRLKLRPEGFKRHPRREDPA